MLVPIYGNCLGRSSSRAAFRPHRSARASCRSVRAASGGGNGGAGKGSGGGGWGGWGGDSGQPEDDDEPLLSLAEAQTLAAAGSRALPADFAAVAAAEGLRGSVLTAWLELNKNPLLARLAAVSPFLRDRFIADPLLGFKLGLELSLDVGLAAITEAQRRGREFWETVEFFVADLAVGSALDTALVTLVVAPATLGRFPRLAAPPLPASLLAKLPPSALKAWNTVLAVPPTAFGVLPKGARFSAAARAASILRLGLLYGIVGVSSGAIGQAAANLAAAGRRAVKRAKGLPMSEADELQLPSVPRTAALWGGFMATSANLRFQALAGLDAGVLALPLSARLPMVPLVVTGVARTINAIVGGEHFQEVAASLGGAIPYE